MFESKRRAIIFFAISIIFAFGAVYLFGDYVQKTEKELGQLVPILVAKNDIPAGSPITDEMLDTIKVPKKYAVESFIKSKKEVQKKISLVPIPKGEVITTAMLRKTSKVASEFRVVQLRVPMAVFDEQIDVLDKVDLFGSYEKADKSVEENADKRATEIVLQDVKVVTVYKKGDEIIAIGVALTPENAKRVVWMLNYGKELRVVKSNSSVVNIGGGN